jgi:peptidoglycan/xylan/chitin deacetylase (PgdA/CDA1 family)
MANPKICFVSVDVEDDQNHPLKPLSQRTWEGARNLNNILDVFNRHNMPATLFTTGQVLERFPKLAKQWSKKYEIACHSFAHNFLNTMSEYEREQDLENYFKLYKKIFTKSPRGFRAPSHIIDPKQIKLLRDKGFLYDSSVVPRFPLLMKYRGFKRRAPITPYFPARANCRKKGDMEILEIPVSGLLLGIPLWGGALRYIPFTTYKELFKIRAPSFISLSMHSWDAILLKGRKSKNSGNKFLKILDRMIVFLETKNYKFMDGESIAKNYEIKST